MSPLECSHNGVAQLKAQHVPVFRVPARTSQNTNLDEIPRPVFTTDCSQDSFMFFKRKWVRYVKYYERDGGGKKGDGEIQNQLFSCLDTVLQTILLQVLDKINTGDDMLDMVQIFAVVKNENYSTMPNKYETAAAVEIGESVQNTKI